ncbi:MBL fold metallo-hydrolase [Nocardia aurantia]|uniref:MBL fold metallo-hydrolase n=1 Tax=Nocardia aurantia TaxID=2585199 RepID=A0A7K0DVU8_9NOCA|nr:MBL fold metallo-hydrolase [Nocardia aurantia]MQY29452.1 hypothetical protein [Nocardia aurantia]
MNLTHYGHACVLAEISTRAAEIRILIDPGTYATGFEDLRDLTAVLVTHRHPDHLDIDRLATLLTHNRDAVLVGDPETAATLTDSGFDARATAPGDRIRIGGVRVDVLGGEHACIHPGLPAMANNGYLIDGRLLHPGDDLTAIPPAGTVDTVLIPVGGPWMKIGEAIDYLRALAPRTAVPIHEAGLAPVHRLLHHQLLRQLAPPSCAVAVPEHGTPLTL